LTQVVSPDDEHDVLETCRYRVKNKNRYIERNLCVTFVIYQEPRSEKPFTKELRARSWVLRQELSKIKVYF
jgi:isopentenyldiphosphate isomerase